MSLLTNRYGLLTGSRESRGVFELLPLGMTREQGAAVPVALQRLVMNPYSPYQREAMALVVKCVQQLPPQDRVMLVKDGLVPVERADYRAERAVGGQPGGRGGLSGGVALASSLPGRCIPGGLHAPAQPLKALSGLFEKRIGRPGAD